MKPCPIRHATGLAQNPIGVFTDKELLSVFKQRFRAAYPDGGKTLADQRPKLPMCFTT